MNRLTRALAGMRMGWKRLTAMVFSRASWTFTWGALPTSQHDYRGIVGDGSGSSIVAACTRWITTTFPEAPLQVVRLERDGGRTVLPDHPLVALLERPNPAYSGPTLWGALIGDLFLAGNAYLAKVRARSGTVTELWWIPQQLITPKWPTDENNRVWISHYEYTPNGTPIRLDVADVVHLRYRLNPVNPRLGLSPLAAVLSEVWTDMEAAAFTGALLRNTGVPGVIISPDVDKATITPDQAELMKANFIQKFGGDHRGEPMVVQGAIKTQVLSFSPEQMNLKDLRRLPEERVTAVLGIPAVVAGLGVGMDHSIYNNVSQAREAAYEELIIPLQRLLAADLGAQLLPDFGDSTALRIQFDLSHVKVLQEDQDALMKRAAEGFQRGVLTRAEAREMVGMVAEPEDEVFALPVQLALIPRDTPPVPPAPPAPLALPPGPAEDEDALREAVGLVGAARKAAQDAAEVSPADVRQARAWVASLDLPELEAALSGREANGVSQNGNGRH